MKKWFLVTIALVLIAALILAGCGRTATTPAQTTTTAPPTTTTTTTQTTTTTTTTRPPTTTTTAPTTATTATTTTTRPPSPTATTTTTITAPPTTTTTAGNQPVYGGKVVMVRNTGITAVGAPQDVPTNTSTYPLWCAVAETLVQVDAVGRIVPHLAEAVEISPDGKTVTFKLRKGVKFHDGTDFNAQAVKYNLEAVKAAKVSGSAVLDNVTSYDIVDGYTIKANLKTFDATFLNVLASSGIGVMISPTALAKPTTPENAGKDHLIGTGPFVFDSWSLNQYIRMKKNPNYWQPGRPYLDEFEIRSITDYTTAVLSFKAGEVDMVESIDPAQYNELKAQGYTVGIPEGLAFVFSYRTDNANPNSPFSKKAVREALWYAVDREGMTKGLGKGTYNVANQLAAPFQDWYIKDYPVRPYDPVKAKLLLGSAGYPDGFKTVLHGDVRGRQDDLVALKNYFEVIGIQCTLDVADPARSSTFKTQGFDGIFQDGFPNWSTFSGWFNVFVNSTLTYPTMAFPAGFKEGWIAAKSEPDYDKRVAMTRALFKQVYDEAIVMPWMWDSPRYVVNAKVQNLKWDAVEINGYYDPVNVWKKK